MDRAVFLDRDNTLIANDGDLGDPDLVQLLRGVGPALSALHRGGYRLIVVSNQGGVARGRFSEADVDAVNERIARLLEDETGERRLIERFYYCPHHPEGTIAAYRREHPWRKPQPGMLLQAASDLELDLGRSWMIGDQQRDVVAGHAAGCRTVLVGPPERAVEIKPTACAPTLSDAARLVLGLDDGSDRAPTEPSTGSTRPTGPTPPLGDPSPEHRLHRALHDLAEELRTERVRRGEFTALRMLAGFCQLLVLLLALLGLLQLQSFETFARWMIGAILVQLATVSLLLLDLNR